eukprot:4820707-Alexandrium_andersonii.AAC.1
MQGSRSTLCRAECARPACCARPQGPRAGPSPRLEHLLRSRVHGGSLLEQLGFGHAVGLGLLRVLCDPPLCIASPLRSVVVCGHGRADVR